MRTSLRLRAALLALALLTGLSACNPEDPYIPTEPPPVVENPAFLRVLHMAPEAPAVTPILGGEVFLGPTSYLTVQSGVNEAKYYPADTTTKRIDFTLGGPPLAGAPIDLKNGHYYTAYFHGRPGDYRVLVTEDTVQPNPPASTLKMRVVNMAPDAPPLDLWISTSQKPVAVNAAYGTASDYDVRPTTGLGRPAMTAVSSTTGDTLFRFPENRFPFPSEVIFTLVITGYHRPTAEQPLIAVAAFAENSYDPDDRLFGGLPIRVEFAAIRFVNIIAAPTGLFELTFYDQDYFEDFHGENEGFRRNYAGQEPVLSVEPLGVPGSVVKGYFLQSVVRTVFPYRIERDLWGPDSWTLQPAMTKTDTLVTEMNKRFTVVAYGPDSAYAPGVVNHARSTWMRDNVPAPSTDGQTRLRFFHGSFGRHEATRLKLRVFGIESVPMAYGQAPLASQAIEVPAGPGVTVEILDESGAVVYAAQHSFTGGETYTVYFFPGADGVTDMTRPVGDAIDAQ